MKKPLKILVVRFSSIGDVLLTSPVVRCLKSQLNAEVHFVTKLNLQLLVKNNPNIDKVYYLNNSLYSLIKSLQKENYDYIIDLHNNIRSLFLISLGTVIKRYSKSNFKKFLYMNFNINYLDGKHVVDRYMSTINFLGVQNDNLGIDYYIDPKNNVDFNITQKYIAWNLGASKNQKKLSIDQIYNVISEIAIPIVLLGGVNEITDGNSLMSKFPKRIDIFNFCGELNLDQSAFLIQNSLLLLTNDSGLMHRGSAFKKNIISFWGCTKPNMGFAPYISKNRSVQILSNESERQCSKHGNSCRYIEDGCVKLINYREISEAVKKFIS